MTHIECNNYKDGKCSVYGIPRDGFRLYGCFKRDKLKTLIITIEFYIMLIPNMFYLIYMINKEKDEVEREWLKWDLGKLILNIICKPFYIFNNRS